MQTTIVPYKRCIWCLTDKVTSEFHRNQARKDGLDSRCKVCILAYSLKRREASRPPKRDNPAAYLQTKFGPPKRKRTGAFVICEACSREFYVCPSRIKQEHSIRFCSMKCYDKHGDNNPFWGKNHKSESIAKMMDSPNRNGAERLISWNQSRWADTIGCRKIDSFVKESGKCNRCGFADTAILVVHHIDRNRRNNQRANLEVLCPNCHASEHFKSGDGGYNQIGRSKAHPAFCMNGHELIEANVRLYRTSGGSVLRACRTCERDRARKRSREKRRHATQLRLL